MFHLATLYDLTTLITAFQLSLLALISDVHVHVIEDKLDSTVQQAVDQAVGTNLAHMRLQVLANDKTTVFRIIRAFNWGVVAFSNMPFRVAAPHNCLALLIRAIDRELQHESPDRNVRLQSSNDLLVA